MLMRSRSRGRGSRSPSPCPSGSPSPTRSPFSPRRSPRRNLAYGSVPICVSLCLIIYLFLLSLSL
jgi:hypothetical protein